MIGKKDFILFTQLINLVLIAIYNRSEYIWYLSIASFIQCIIMIFISDDKKYTLLSIITLFLSQHSIFIFARSNIFYSQGSDTANDYATTLFIQFNKFFELGSATYSSRTSYSFYPFLHLFTVIYNYFSLIPLSVISFFLIPALNAIFVPTLLYQINKNLFKIDDRMNYLAIVIFGLNWYYTQFQSNYVRESFAIIFGFTVLWLTSEILNRKNGTIALWITNLSIFSALILSHHITSFIIIALLFLIFITSKTARDNKGFKTFMSIITASLVLYSIAVPRDFLLKVVNQILGSLNIDLSDISGQAITKQIAWKQYFILAYYGSIGLIAFIAYLRMLINKNRENETFLLYTLFGAVFGIAVILRLTTSPNVWGWAYFMSLRATTWAFVGLGVLAALGLDYLLKYSKKVKISSIIIIILLVSLLSVGKLSQFSNYFDDKSVAFPMNDSRFQASKWLKDNAIAGHSLLIPTIDAGVDAYEGAREMAPIAFLKEHFLTSQNITGSRQYIPFINSSFNIYKNDTLIQQIYSNGRTEIGYR